MQTRSPHRVVILGAGFGGLRVARLLGKDAARRHLAVTLVSRSPSHLYTPSFYALAGTSSDTERHRILERVASVPVRRSLAGLPVSFLVGEIVGIDDADKAVTLGDGRRVAYDTLVVALGSEPAHYGIPGLKERAITLKSLRDAETVSRRIATLLRGRVEPLRIVVGGGGATGVELSATLAETVATRQAGARITLVEAGPEVLPGLDPRLGREARARLEEREVVVRTSQAITAVEAGAIGIGSKEGIAYDLLIWTGGVQAPALLSTLPYVLERGRLVTDAPLTCVPLQGATTDRHVYALGDATVFHYGQGVAPWTAHMAARQADVVAGNIVRTVTGKPLMPFRLGMRTQLYPLGSTGGIGIITGVIIRGRTVQLLAKVARLLHSISTLGFGKGVRFFLRG